MSSRFVRILGGDLDIAVNLERVHLVMKGTEVTSVYFTGDTDPLVLHGEGAESFWRCIAGLSMCIHRPSYAKNQGDETLVKE
jgi:hypothetical protein